MSKPKIDQTKSLLNQALRSIPSDFALSEVRYHLLQAVNKLEQVEQKQSKKLEVKPTQHQRWQESLKSNLQNFRTAPATIDIIDDMLSKEQEKLENIINSKRKPTKDGEEQTLLD